MGSIGVDIVDIARFKKNRYSPRDPMLSAFSKEELRYCLSRRDPAPHLAARFAAKEAAWKAFAGATKTFRTPLVRFVHEVEVCRDKEGRPKLRFTRAALQKYGARVSLAHSDTQAVAVVLIS